MKFPFTVVGLWNDDSFSIVVEHVEADYPDDAMGEATRQIAKRTNSVPEDLALVWVEVFAGHQRGLSGWSHTAEYREAFCAS